MRKFPPSSDGVRVTRLRRRADARGNDSDPGLPPARPPASPRRYYSVDATFSVSIIQADSQRDNAIYYRAVQSSPAPIRDPMGN